MGTHCVNNLKKCISNWMGYDRFTSEGSDEWRIFVSMNTVPEHQTKEADNKGDLKIWAEKSSHHSYDSLKLNQNMVFNMPK